jgi:hypothetical protein
MTVYIEKPAVNLREELASLRNQGGYQEQQFYFDSLVTNGTFDINTTGWTFAATATNSSSAGYLEGSTATNNTLAYTTIATVVGQTYTVQMDVVSATATAAIMAGTSAFGSTLGISSYVATGNTATFTFVATGSLTYISVRSNSVPHTVRIDNVSIFETDGTDVVHRLPKGWKPKDVFEDGLLQREGAAYDYEVVYDGFDYYVKPTVAPSATTQTCVIGVKA